MERARPATRHDLDAVATLARAAIEELTPLRGGAVWRAQQARREPLEAALATLLEEPGARVLVGTLDGEILGYAVARIEVLDGGVLLGVVEDLYVDPEARSVGLGEALVEDLTGWCRQRSCVGMDAIALPGQRSTKNFFEGAGFTARKLVMHRSLRTTPDGGAEP